MSENINKYKLSKWMKPISCFACENTIVLMVSVWKANWQSQNINKYYSGGHTHPNINVQDVIKTKGSKWIKNWVLFWFTLYVSTKWGPICNTFPISKRYIRIWLIEREKNLKVQNEYPLNAAIIPKNIITNSTSVTPTPFI